MKINILGRDFRVEEFGPSPMTRAAGDDDTCGCMVNAMSTIYIDPNQEIQSKESTLLHEVIEAVNSMLELKLEHTQICSLETGIYSAIREKWKPFQKVSRK